MKAIGLSTAALAMTGCTSDSSKIEGEQSGAKRPNVILIAADDLGYGDLGCFDNPDICTPNIDCLAANGVSLTQHYSASPLCAPARAALLTGRYNHRTGAVDVPSNRGLDRIALNEVTLANAMKIAGYATGMVGKWHNGVHDMRYHPNARGFDEFAGFLNGGMDYWKWVLDYNGVPHPADGRYLTDVFTQESINFIERHRENSFFLYIAYNAPHSPFQAPKELINKYHRTGKFTKAVSAIYAMIEQMDTGIGQIMEKLKSLGLADNTIVVFTSDNGPSMRGTGEDCTVRYNAHFSGQKGDVLEGGIRVPAIVHWPEKIPGGIITRELVHFIDWFPTLVSLTGKPHTDGLPIDGQNVLPILQGKSLRVSSPRFWFWQRNRYEPAAYCNAAVRDGKWKLYWQGIPEAMSKDPGDNIPYRKGLTEGHWLMDIDTTLPERTLSAPRQPRLFDMEADPYEKTDLAAQYTERAGEMRSQWDAWFEEVTAEWHKARACVIELRPTKE